MAHLTKLNDTYQNGRITLPVCDLDGWSMSLGRAAVTEVGIGGCWCDMPGASWTPSKLRLDRFNSSSSLFSARSR